MNYSLHESVHLSTLLQLDITTKTALSTYNYIFFLLKSVIGIIFISCYCVYKYPLEKTEGGNHEGTIQRHGERQTDQKKKNNTTQKAEKIDMDPR